MKILRIFSFLFPVLMFVDQWLRIRFFGLPVMDASDEVLCGVFLFFAAILLSKDTTRRRATLAAAWAFLVALYYKKTSFATLDAEEAARHEFFYGLELIVEHAIIMTAALLGLAVCLLHKRVH